MSKQLFDQVAALSAEDRANLAALLNPGGPAAPAPVQKFSHFLDRVPEGEVGRIVEACGRALRAAATKADPGDADAAAVAVIEEVSPALAAAARANSARRFKPFVHSVRVTADYLVSPEGKARRAARAVPATTTSAPTTSHAAAADKGK